MVVIAIIAILIRLLLLALSRAMNKLIDAIVVREHQADRPKPHDYQIIPADGTP